MSYDRKKDDVNDAQSGTTQPTYIDESGKVFTATDIVQGYKPKGSYKGYSMSDKVNSKEFGKTKNKSDDPYDIEPPQQINVKSLNDKSAEYALFLEKVKEDTLKKVEDLFNEIHSHWAEEDPQVFDELYISISPEDLYGAFTRAYDSAEDDGSTDDWE